MAKRSTTKTLLKNILPTRIVEIYSKNKYPKIENLNLDIQTINFNIVGYCNSKCVMCGIWEQNDKTLVSLDEFATILKDPLFENVKSINFLGGEPTLVNNLEDYYVTAIKTLPNLAGMSLTSNAVNTNRLKEVVLNITKLCKENNIDLILMLSIDGYEDIHDANRGVIGGFAKNMEMINWLKVNKIPFGAATTITKVNIWNLDYLLYFFKKKDIHARFRVAIFAERLFNKDKTDFINNFDNDEIYQILIFLSKLEYNYEKSNEMNHIYRSMKSILMGDKRTVDCHYKSRSCTILDCHGGMSLCSAKSDIYSNFLKQKGQDIYLENIKVLENIEENYCPDCIHDNSNGQPNEPYMKEWEREQYMRGYLTISNYNNLKNTIEIENIINDDKIYSIFIVGWYGTETTGDKAILGGIIDEYLCKYGDKLKIFIASLYPFVTERTIYELNVEAKVIPVFHEEFFKYSYLSNEVVVGGGPLMELEELSLIEWALYLSRKNGKKTTVYGCGIGPLYSPEKTDAVKEILSLSDIVYLRDNKSINLAKNLVGAEKSIENIGDPAKKYIDKLNGQTDIKIIENKLSFFLRELSYEYYKDMPFEDFLCFKSSFENELAKNIIILCKQTGFKPHFYSMSNFIIGADDRDFNYHFVDNYLSDVDTYIENKLSTVESVIKEMKSSKLSICMRFHSLVFAHTLGIPFSAIDYTNGGKIESFLYDNSTMDNIIKMEDIINNNSYIYDRYNENFV